MSNETNDQMNGYLADIREIKSLLTANQQKPLVPAWAFYAWAVVIALGTCVHAFLSFSGSPWLAKALYVVWLPALLIGSLFEAAGFVQVFRRQQPVLLSPKVLNTYLSLGGLWLSFTAILVFLFSRGQLTPGLLLCILAACYMVIAQLSWYKLLVPGFLLLLLGLVFLLLDWSGSAAIVVTGLACALAFALGGLVSRRETGRHG